MKVVLAEKTSPAAIKMLREEPGWTIVTADQINSDLPSQIEDADALIVRSAVQADDALLAHGKKLRVIGRAGVGVDNIDLDAATKRGIVVMNTPGGNAVAVAEHTFGLMLSMARFLSKADTTTRAGKWEKKSLQGTELRGKTLGIVGLGRIGMEVAKRATAFQMKVIAHDPFVAQNIARDLGITLGSLDEVFAQSDYISLHVGLTPQTEKMINAAAISKMKKGVRIVNCARGELLNEPEVVEALKSGQIGGLAVDVYPKEPPKDSPLLTLENVVATPHIAGSTNEAQEAVGIQIVQQVKEYLTRGVIQNAVNVPSVSDEEYAEMNPYISLAEKLGSLAAQLCSGSAEEIAIGYEGRIAEWKTQLIRNAALKGALNQLGGADANVVNAHSVAAERGVRVSENKKPEKTSLGNVLAVSLKGPKVNREVRGIVLHGSPRLAELDGIDIETPLGGSLIYLQNKDVPGVIGQIGTTVGKHKVNIANFTLGRAQSGGEALALVQVDGDVPAALLDELRKLDSIKQVCAVRL